MFVISNLILRTTVMASETTARKPIPIIAPNTPIVTTSESSASESIPYILYHLSVYYYSNLVVYINNVS